jgi:predicted SnoaL-like aldol condensation-catalyzing enzyme
MHHYTDNEKRNLQMTRDFYDKVLNGMHVDALDRYIAVDYIQHAPASADGLAGLRAFLEEKRAEAPANVTFTVKRMFADGDHVIVHHHVHWEGFRGLAVVDIFRIAGDKFVEHWDVIQPIPEQSKNSNTMF